MRLAWVCVDLEEVTSSHGEVGGWRQGGRVDVREGDRVYLVTPAQVVTPLMHPGVQGVYVCVLTPVGFVIAHVEVTAFMQCKNFVNWYDY